MVRADKVLSLLGIAARARRIASGEFQTEHAVKSGEAYLVMVANDASENTKKRVRSMCEYYQVPMAVYATREELGHCIGKEFRASLAVTDKGLAESVEKKLADKTTE